MNIALVNNGQVVSVGDYRTLFPQTSFPVSGPGDEFMTQNSALRVNSWLAHDPLTQKLQSCDPYILDNAVFTVEVVPLTQEDVDARNQSLAAEIRQKRDSFLADSDWTQTLDSRADQREVWQAYRQALRDIPEQAGFPTAVVWPEPPL